jgi:hypothetical protein
MTLDGLEVGKLVWFRHRVLMRKTGLTEWGQSVSHVVT